jgi:hypothetical protein
MGRERQAGQGDAEAQSKLAALDADAKAERNAQKLQVRFPHLCHPSRRRTVGTRRFFRTVSLPRQGRQCRVCCDQRGAGKTVTPDDRRAPPDDRVSRRSRSGSIGRSVSFSAIIRTSATPMVPISVSRDTHYTSANRCHGNNWDWCQEVSKSHPRRTFSA